MKDPHTIIVAPRITEKTFKLSQGDPRIQEDEKIARSYTFLVAPSSNKIEIKAAFEAIYNAGKKDKIEVAKVRTITTRGKSRRVGNKTKGKKPDFKKAVITLMPGQILEDYGV